MSQLLLGVVACTSAVFGILFNAYIILVLVYNRQTRTANSLLLLHLALVDILSCLETLAMTTPAAVNERWGDQQASPLCAIHGFVWTALLPVAVWTLCGLNCDRYAAIAAPLHYSRLVRSRRVLLFLALAWLFGVALAVPPFFHGVNRYSFQPSRASCAADFADRSAGPWYPLAYTALSLVLPAFLILLCNLRILVIARHHRHRIVAALYEVTVRAQATITHQRNPFYLSKYKGRCAVVTIVQLVGSVLLLYGPQCGLMVWEATTGRVGPPELAGVAAGLVACSPLLNGFVYGVKSRALRKAFRSFLRRQLYTSEVHNEIQRRGSMGANHAWSYVLLRMHKNSVLAATQGDAAKRLKHGPEGGSPLPRESYGHAGADLGLAGLGLTLGIGLSNSDLGDVGTVPPASTPDIQIADAGGGTCDSLESVLLSKDASPVDTGRQSPESVQNSGARRPSEDAALLAPYHDTLPAKGSQRLKNGKALPLDACTRNTDKDHCLLRANGRNGIEHQLRKSLEVLSKKNGCLQRRSPSCGFHLELLQTAEGRNSRAINGFSPLFIERGSI